MPARLIGSGTGASAKAWMALWVFLWLAARTPAASLAILLVAVAALLDGQLSPAEAVDALMGRELKPEFR